MKKLFLFIFCSFDCFITSAQQSTIDSLLTLLKNEKEDTVKVTRLNKISEAYWHNNASDSAFAFANSALKLGQQLNFKTGIVYAYRNIGWAVEANDYPKALDYFLKALKISEALGEKKEIAIDFRNIGTNALNRVDNLKAMDYYLRALKMHEELEDKNEIATDLGYIASASSNQGNYSKALEYSYRALEIYEESGNKKKIANTLNQIGNQYNAKKDYPNALKNYLRGLKIYEESGDKENLAVSYNNIGMFYSLQGKTDEALKNYFSALKINEAVGKKQGIASSLSGIGTTFFYMENYSEALKYLLKAVKILEEIGDKNSLSSVYNTLSAIYYGQENFKEALVFGKKGIAAAEEIGSVYYMKNAYQNLAGIYYYTNNYKLACQNLVRFKEMNDSLFNMEKDKKITQMQMQYEFDKKQNAQNAEQKQKETIAKSEISKQKLIRNSTFGGVGLAAVFSFFLVRAYNRKKKVSFEKQISDVEMKALRSQMNPHFIFNSLHSINKFMMDNDKGNASEFLSKFSKLMRLILENSREHEVALEKDLSALELYMQLESLRFQNRFKYKIEVDENIDKENTLVPPMMLQPFVENSIIHGLSNKDNGMIKVAIKKENNMIHCSVEDNGIGREKTMSMNSTEKEKSKSLAMNITHERISIINRLKNAKAALNIFDLKDAENNPAGLRVELNLPLELAF